MKTLLTLIFVIIVVYSLYAVPQCVCGDTPWPFNNKSKQKYQHNMQKLVDWYNPEDHSKPYYCRRKVYCKLCELPKISFKQFESFYQLNPDSWYLYPDRVCKDDNTQLSFTFSYKDWKSYQKFRDKIAKEEEQKAEAEKQKKILDRQNEITINILTEVQKDIDAIRQLAADEMDQARETVVNATEKLANENNPLKEVQTAQPVIGYSFDV